MVEEVSDEAEVRQSSSSLLSAAASFRRPALTVAVLGAAAVIVVVARHTLAESLHVLAAASPGWLLLALAAEAVSLTAFGMSRTLPLVAGAIAGSTSAASAAGYAGAAVYLLPVVGVLLALRFDRMRALLRTVLERLAALSKRAFGKPEDGGAGVDRFLDEVSSRRLSLPGYGRVFGLALANWAFDGAVLALSIRAMGQPVPWDDLLLVYGAGAAVASTGLTPGGFALVELAMTAALTASGLHSSAALAAVVAYRFISFWLVLLGGWVAFIVLAHPLRRRRGQ